MAPFPPYVVQGLPRLSWWVRGFALAGVLSGTLACAVDLGGTGPSITPYDAGPTGTDLGGGGSDTSSDAADGGHPPQKTDAAQQEQDADASEPVAVDAGPSSGCSLEGRFALRVAYDVSWVGTALLSIVPVISAGEGELSFVVLMEARSDAKGALAVVARECDSSVPEFISTLPQEHYAVRFDHAVWDSPKMPLFSTTWSAACTEPGCRFQGEPLVALIGAALPSPMATWPSGAGEGEWPDHDGDGEPGVAAYMLGPNDPGGFDYPPLDFLATRRVRDLRLGLRVIVGLDGKLDSCDELSGAAVQGSVDTRAVGCEAITKPTRCTSAELSFLDDNLPIWTVRKGRFQAKRLSLTADCKEARRAFAQGTP